MLDKLVQAMRSTVNMSSVPHGACGSRIVIEMSDETALYELLSSAWDAARAAKAPLVPDNYCAWCSEAILPGQPTGTSDGERMHIGCAAEEMDNATFDRDFGDS